MKVLKWIGIFLLGFAAAFLVLTIVLKLLFPAERIKSIVVPQVEKILERDVSIEGAGISLYPVLGVKLRGVEVSNTEREGFSDDSFVKFQRFLAGVKVLPLLKKEVKINDIRLINPEFLIEIDTSGSYNFDDLGFMKEKGVPEQEDKAGKEGLPLLPVPVSLEHLSIKDASLIYRDMSSGNEISIDTLNQRVDFSIDKELRDITSTGELSVRGIFLNTPLLKKPLDGLEVSFNHNIGMDY
ncbi:MAG: AsmA family protein, partial [Chitinivibrionales bacterium]